MKDHYQISISKAIANEFENSLLDRNIFFKKELEKSSNIEVTYYFSDEFSKKIASEIKTEFNSHEQVGISTENKKTLFRLIYELVTWGIGIHLFQEGMVFAFSEFVGIKKWTLIIILIVSFGILTRLIFKSVKNYIELIK